MDEDKNSLKNRIPDWLRSVGLFLFIFVLFSLAGFLPGIGFLRYYIDGYSINRRAFFTRAGEILWERPVQVPAGFNKISNNYDATISPDGKFVIFSHKFSDDNTELYISYYKDEKWTKPVLLEEVNSDWNDKNPDISYDGKYLYFSSNRPGGKGGFDIWCSEFDGKKWAKPFHIGGSINSKYDDVHPELSPQKDYFYFSSNRPVDRQEQEDEKAEVSTEGKDKEDVTDFNIFRAAKIDDKKIVSAVSGPPAFIGVEYMDILNSPFNEGKLTITGRGDLAYFSSDRPGGKGGFDIYRTHFFENKFTEPQNFGAPVNSPYDEISPTLSLEGFKIYFSSNKYSRSRSDYRFYETLSRQVISRFDYSILIALFLIIATIAMIYYLMKLLLSNVNMKVITRCLLASILLHLLLLLFSSTWFIGGKIKEALLEGPDEMTININNLARENISVAIREGIASLPKVTSTMPAVRPQYIPSPSQQQPMTETAEPVTKQVAKSSTAVTPVSIAETSDAPSESGSPSNTSEITAVMPSLLGASNIRMEVPGGKGKKATGSSKGKGRNLPKPPDKPRPIKKMSYEVAKISVPMKLETTDVEADIPGVSQTVTRDVKRHSAVSNVGKVSDSARSMQMDTLPGLSEDMAAASGTQSSVSSMGMFLMPVRMKMEIVPKKHKDYKLPKLGMLKKDWMMASNLEYELAKEDRWFYDLKYIKEMLKVRNLMKFDAFDSFNLLMVRKKGLRPVGNLIYQGAPRLDMPADSELELPEGYQP